GGVIEDVAREIGRIPVPPDQDRILVAIGFAPGGALFFDHPPERLEALHHILVQPLVQRAFVKPVVVLNPEATEVLFDVFEHPADAKAGELVDLRRHAGGGGLGGDLGDVVAAVAAFGNGLFEHSSPDRFTEKPDLLALVVY